MADTADISSKLAALQQQFIHELAGKLDELTRCVANQGPDITRPLLEDAHARLHRLTGSAGTFGYGELSRQARQLETTAQQWLDAKTTPSSAQWASWQQQVSSLPDTLRHPDKKTAAIARIASPDTAEESGRVRIATLAADAALCNELVQGLKQFGYDISAYASYPAAETGLLDKPADILIVDMMLHGQNPAHASDELSRLFKKLGKQLATICLTERTDFDMRLNTARLGGEAFVTKPVDIPGLASHIERIVKERSLAPYRVLIVDDDELLAEHFRLVLSAAGMLAEKITQPRQVMDAIMQLHPDLLLLDLHMPDCSGTELARAIRYDSEWLGLPIVFISAEYDLDRQIEALGSGADDFITKPISDIRLITAVRARAARARKVSELMSQDSLTGLLKHASIKDRLQQEMDRAKRQSKPLAIAMIDIDHFKKVNDTWGHPMGDKVIKTLAHLLRQRLRHQDSIGRYGGEEFAAVLPECTVADATRIIEDIRQSMAAMNFSHEGENFSVTISAGIAATDRYSDTTSLIAAADAALYSAKRAGRNQIASG